MNEITNIMHQKDMRSQYRTYTDKKKKSEFKIPENGSRKTKVENIREKIKDGSYATDNDFKSAIELLLRDL